MMTQAELEAAADALAKVLAKYGYAAFVSRDQEREAAAAVIEAYEKAKSGQ